MNKRDRCTAIVLSAGQGKRMGTAVQKQYIEIEEKPVIYYTLQAFQTSDIIDDIILVVGKGQERYVREEIVAKYCFTKVISIVPGGAERYDSVWQGILAAQQCESPENYERYLFIHDGARMFVDEAVIEKGYETVKKYRACVAGMPSKDTVKIVDADGFAATTPERKYVWTVQTPQIFEKKLITEAYRKLMGEQSINVTDDAMVVEQMMHVPVKLYEASYENIKITTPEDLETAKVFLRKRKERKD